MNKFEKIEKKIGEITKNAPSDNEFSHSRSVLKWVLKLKPSADASLKIAALGHDIDRSFPKLRINPDDYTDEEYVLYKKKHAEKSAQIVSDLMEEIEFDKKTIEKTNLLIQNHETGGEGDFGVLMEADSISFFENNLLSYSKQHPKYLRDKIKFMYKRLSKTGKELVLGIELENQELKKIVKESIGEI
jgi:hypothetical protein